jgi:hypothetical protein
MQFGGSSGFSHQSSVIRHQTSNINRIFRIDDFVIAIPSDAGMPNTLSRILNINGRFGCINKTPSWNFRIEIDLSFCDCLSETRRNPDQNHPTLRSNVITFRWTPTIV